MTIIVHWTKVTADKPLTEEQFFEAIEHVKADTSYRIRDEITELWGLPVVIEDTPLTRALGWYVIPGKGRVADETKPRGERRVASGELERLPHSEP